MCKKKKIFFNYKKYCQNCSAFITEIYRKISFFIIPPVCPLCTKYTSKTHEICADCWKNLCFIQEPFCEIFGTPLHYNSAFNTAYLPAQQKPPPFRKARAVLHHDHYGRMLITRYKYYDSLHLTPILGNFMIQAGEELIKECDLIIPIPLHFYRYFMRNYNQAAELALYIAKKSHKKFEPNILKRIKNTKQQARLRPEERRANVKNAFYVSPKFYPLLKNKVILLIDDVYTTGETAKSATNALLKANVKHVDVLTFTRVC